MTTQVKQQRRPSVHFVPKDVKERLWVCELTVFTPMAQNDKDLVVTRNQNPKIQSPKMLKAQIINLQDIVAQNGKEFETRNG